MAVGVAPICAVCKKGEAALPCRTERLYCHGPVGEAVFNSRQHFVRLFVPLRTDCPDPTSAPSGADAEGVGHDIEFPTRYVVSNHAGHLWHGPVKAERTSQLIFQFSGGRARSSVYSRNNTLIYSALDHRQSSVVFLRRKLSQVPLLGSLVDFLPEFMEHLIGALELSPYGGGSADAKKQDHREQTHSFHVLLPPCGRWGLGPCWLTGCTPHSQQRPGSETATREIGSSARRCFEFQRCSHR